MQTPSPEEDQGLKCRDCGWSHPEWLLQPLPVSATSQDQLHHSEWSLPTERNRRRVADALVLTNVFDFPPIRGSPSLRRPQRWRPTSSPVKCHSQMHCLRRRDAVRAVSCTKVRKHICAFLRALWFASKIGVAVIWKRSAVANHSRPWMFWRLMVDWWI